MAVIGTLADAIIAKAVEKQADNQQEKVANF